MPYSGSGSFTRLYDWTTDRDGGVKILASKMDDEMDGFATGLSTAICKDGQTTITANIPWNNNKITGLAAGTAATDAARLDQVQKSTTAWAAAGGTADAITASFTPTLTAIATGSVVRVRASAANTSTTPTFNPDSLGAETITKNGGQALIATDIYAAGHELLLQKKATGYELLNPAWGGDTTAFATTLLDDANAAAAIATLNLAGTDLAHTVAQTVTLATAGNNLTLTTTDAGATGSTQRLYHNTASPANSDVPGTILFDGKDSGAADQTWARIRSSIVDVTAASENATLELATVEAGTLANRVTVGGTGGGVQIGSPTGGDKGAGTVNAAADYYYNNAALPQGIAAQSDQETGTSTVLAVTPGRQQFHAGHPKAWVLFDNNGAPAAITADYGVNSVSDTGVGRAEFTFDTAFSATTAYGGGGMAEEQSGIKHNFSGRDNAGTHSATVFPFHTCSAGGGGQDNDYNFCSWNGDQ